MSGANFNGTINFTDTAGRSVDVVEEVKKLRASVDLLVRLSHVAIGNVNISALSALRSAWFERVFTDFGQGWSSGSGVVFGSDIEHYDTGIRVKIPYAFLTPDNQWQFINGLKLAIASHKHGGAARTVEDLIRAVIRSLPESVDPVTRVGALAAVCPEEQPVAAQ